jgi:LysR family transcriptional regulator, hydrogen peroxide-inducible genes activator
LSLRDLEYLVAVAECRHFGRAAERCGVSQPALSAQVRKLESWLGVTVFERAPGRVLLTGQGAALLARVQGVLAEARGLVEQARAAGAPLAGAFRIGAIPTIGPYFLPHALRPMREAFPEMRPVVSEARTADLVERQKDGALDASLLCLPQTDPALALHPLFFEPFLMMHAAGARPGWPEDGGEGLLVLEEGHCLRDQTLAICGLQAPPGRRHAAGLELLRQMAAAGEGYALMPALAAAALGDVPSLAYGALAAEVGREVALAVRRSDPRAAHLAAVASLFRRIAPEPLWVIA